MLVISQTIFYIVSSVAIIVVGVLLVIVIYYLICILRNTRNISDDITHTYHKTKGKIKKIINSFSKDGKFNKENLKKLAKHAHASWKHLKKHL